MSMSVRPAFRSVRAASVLALLAGAASASLAGVPAALDRVPENFAVYASIDNIERFQTRVESFMTATKLGDLPGAGGDAENPLSQLRSLTELPGINRAGSLVVFGMMKPEAEGTAAGEAAKADADAKAGDGAGDGAGDESGAEDEGEDGVSAFGEDGTLLAIVPVSDFNAFVTGLSGSVADGLASMSFEGRDLYARDLGGGYALVSHDREETQTFEPVTGKLNAHTTLLGTVGGRVADRAEVLLVANIPMVQDEIREGIAAQAEDLEDGAMMPGMEGAGAAIEQFEVIAQNFARDAQVGVIGLGGADGGIWLDVASQFKQGSELAGFFQAAGNASDLLARVPKQSFLFAVAWDQSSEGIRTLIRNAAALSTAAQGENKTPAAIDTFASMAQFADTVDGQAMVIGASPGGLMGGLLVNTTVYYGTKDPQAYMRRYRELLSEANGQKVDGVTFRVTLKENADKAEGVDYDTWQVQMVPDGNNPEAQQMVMSQGFIFGPGGMQGMLAPVDGGVVGTLAPNRLLLAEAIRVGNSGQGLGTEADITAAREFLPEGRTIEAYVGVKPIMEMAQGFLAMFGAPAEFQVPARVSPVAVGATTDAGGVHARIYIPHDVVTAISEVGTALQGMNQGQDGMGEDEDQAPRF